jgi:hypothetical protein
MGKKNKKKKEQKLQQAEKQEKTAKVILPVKRSDKQLYLLIGLIAFLLYINTAGHGYVYDDYSVITGNKLTAKGIESIPELFRTSYWYGMTGENNVIYRPLSLVTIAIENQFSKNDPALSHIMNILFYVLASVLLLKVLLKLFSGYHRAIPFAIALLWVVHPLHTEVVANIKSRDEILSFLFGLLAINFFVYGRSLQKSLLFGGLCYFLALLSKENALTYLAIIPVTVFFFNYNKKKFIYTASVLLGITLIYYLIRSSVLTAEIGDSKLKIIHNAILAAPDSISRIATAIKTLGLYLLKFLFPLHLASDYSYNQVPVSSITSIDFLLSFVILLGSLFYAAIRFRKKDPIAYGIVFFFLAISIVSNLFVLIGSNMADRFMFTPSLGICIIFVFLLVKLFKLIPSGKTISVLKYAGEYKIPAFIVAVVTILFSFKTIDRNKDWKSNLTLFTADIKNSPKSARVKVYYGKELMEIAKDNSLDTAKRNKAFSEAVQLFRQAASIDTTWEMPYLEMGLAASFKKDPQQALAYYQIAGRISPDDYIILVNTGNSYFDLAQYDSAIIFLRKALAKKHDGPDALSNLASCYAVQKQFDSAFRYYRECLDIRPNDINTLRNLGVLNFQLQRYDEAIKYYEQILVLDPGNSIVKQYLEQTRNEKAKTIK